MPGNRIAFFLLGSTLALGFGWAATQVSSALVKMRQEQVIRVKGYAEENVTSDQGTWTCSFSVREAALMLAHERIEQQRSQVLAAITGRGFLANAIHVHPIGIGHEMRLDEKGNRTNTVEWYLLTQRITLTSSNVTLIDASARTITDLIKNGIAIDSQAPEYVYTGIESKKIDLLAKATQNGRLRADTLANNSGGKIGGLSSASQGVFQITPLNSTNVSDYGAYDTSTIEKTVKAVVTLEFQVGK